MGARLFDLMLEGQMLRPSGPGFVSTLAVAAVGRLLFLHTSLRARTPDAVFFGPDSYRFADFIRAEMPTLAAGATILDLGAGSGVGGLVAATLAPQGQLVLSDRNPRALRLAAVNAAFADRAAVLHEGDGAPDQPRSLDLVVANPPYVGGARGPIYSHGGGRRGEAISLRWAAQAMERLAPGGALLLYTGSAIVRGNDPLREGLARACDTAGCDLAYRELDPDVFPSLLLKPAYWGVERIAAVGAVAVRRA
ncbi:SAM-dependent methyltransferase [Phenylobacterium hankyongense]|uniref:SAM-dependent methyltransferase n=1 Tax=Phenylobacterium hankyongense TaxID=1813876 RepID=A0A328AXL2_9CAUL|nr:methyltransferase [Phenylobacterium hankyongense]RAK59830.1 SAM-dependent methyltransferase [Phenylobacterium hankyongense]